ncbi:heterochromatin protein 1-binding protein 3 [Carassius gibelio]|uniref:heterochromatin protein 1-binding protein 3 n=1 Tax=Carassius gibelio TaxID=101364 RepID=UPI002277D116|nr:heterochromatin protein 1-binding protein 3 [Carassius gibelio]
MPIRRSAAAPPKEDAPPANAPDGDAPAEGTATVVEKEKEKEKEKDPTPTEPETKEEKKAGDEGEEVTADDEGQAKDEGETPDEGEKTEEAATEQGKSKKKKAKDVVAKIDKEDDKGKKVKKKIPAWATISANKLASTSLSQPRVEEIMIEAIESCKERSGMSTITIMKYVMKKYPSVEMDKKTKNLYKRALKRMVEKGTVKQLKGKGFSGSFAIGKKLAASAGPKETLGESLPLIITRLCEPKEASYILIKKYLEQHFPQLNVDSRPEVLKNCLQKSVEKGYLEQITGKGASGTFQLKKAGNKVLLGGGLLEDAIVAAITAMNEPKTCSITILRKFLMERQKEQNNFFVVPNLKRTLQKCKMMGWMEQISGHGLSGSYQLSYPYYPSPAVLFPEMMAKLKQKEGQKEGQKLKRKRSDESDEESEEAAEEESEEEESDEDEPPRRKRTQRAKRTSASKARQNKRAKKVSRKPPASKKSVASAKKAPPPAKKAPPPAKKAPPPAKKAPPPAKKPAAASKAVSRKAPEPVKATPVKKAAMTSKPKTPVAKKMTSRGSKRPSPKAAKKEATESAVKAKPAARKSLRARK